MEIYVKLELNQQNLSKLAALLPEAEIVETPEEKVKPAKAEKTEKPTKPTKPEPQEDAPQEKTETASEKITKTDIRAIALKLSKAGKQKDLADIFAKFGCKKLSDFDSRPEDYPELMRELVSANA